MKRKFLICIFFIILIISTVLINYVMAESEIQEEIDFDVQLKTVEEDNTTEIAEGVYYIKTALDTNKVFDVESNSTRNTAKIQLWDKSPQSTDNQKFELISNGDGYYTIKAKHSGKVLDVVGAGQTNGTLVQQYESNGTDAQSWKFENAGNGYYYIVSKCNGLYLDIAGANATNGTKLQVYTGNKTNAQKYKLEEIKIPEKIKSEKTIEDGTYKIKMFTNTNIGLDIASASRNNNANLQIWKSSEVVSKNQMFEITYKSDGYYEILVHHSGKSLDVAGGGTTNGSNVQQYQVNNSDAQKWIIKKNTDESYSILSKKSELCLDITGGKIANGSNVQIYEPNGSNAQKFVFEKVNKASCSRLIEDGIYKINSGLSSSKYIDIASGNYNNGANVQIWDSGAVQQQKFQLTYKEEGYYEIKCVHSGKVLDVAGGSNSNGANVQQYDSNNTEYQKWILQDAGNGYYYILSRGAELYLDVAGASNSNGANIRIYDGNQTYSQKFKFIKTQIIDNNLYELATLTNSNMNIDVDQTSSNVQIWECNYSNNNQKFEVTHIENENYKIICKSSGKALTVDNSGNVIQAEYNNSNNNQKWKIEVGKNGYYYIKSVSTGLYLDVAGGGTTNGTNIQTFQHNNTNSQLFMFVKPITYSTGTYGSTGLKAKGDSRGTDLKYYKYGTGPNVFFATFAIHGWEDKWAKDGSELTTIADDFYNKLITNADYDLNKKWTIYLFPGVNVDGLNYGSSHNGPGRTTLYSQAPGNKGIDLNRCWQIGSTYKIATSDRNYNGTAGFQAYEAQYLRNFLLNNKSKTGQTVLVDLHGWEQSLIGDTTVCEFYNRYFSENTKKYERYGSGNGYLIEWARYSLGNSNNGTARAALIELPTNGINNHQDVVNNNLSGRFIQATLEMLREM